MMRSLFFVSMLLSNLFLVLPLAAQTVEQAPAKTPPAGINERFLDPEMDPQEWEDRFEVESREVYNARQAILAAVDLRSGDTVADVGAGTGLFTVMFAHEVEATGWVYAVDISPRLIEHIASRSDQVGLDNITPVLCTSDDVRLPPNSVDVVFICDTYHHFEQPAKSLESIHQALRADGRLVIVDFIREEGVSSDWVMGHVRAGQDVFRQEILDAGFQLVDEPEVSGLSENYMMIFHKTNRSNSVP